MVRKGKIARLPREIRDELNRRLAENEDGASVLRWVNEVPGVKEILAREFGGAAITKQNLYEWRSGGLVEWQARQEMLEQSREFAGDAQELTAATDGKLADHLATVLAARYAVALSGWRSKGSNHYKLHFAYNGLCNGLTPCLRGVVNGLGERWPIVGCWALPAKKSDGALALTIISDRLLSDANTTITTLKRSTGSLALQQCNLWHYQIVTH